MHWNAGQTVVAEDIVVAVVEVTEGIGLTQGQFADAAAFPEQAVEARFYPLVDGGAGVELLGGQALHDLHGQQLMAHVRVVPGQVPAADGRLAACTQLQGGGGLVLHFDRLGGAGRTPDQ
ncbi:hypothetical protein D9M73_268490 [compost metagenome]